jgi:hypothetical protein
MSSQIFKGGLNFDSGKCKPIEKRKSVRTVTPEKVIQSSFIAWRDMFEGRYPILRSIFAVPNGAWMQNKAYAAAMIRQGLTAGIQDCICLAPSFDRKYHGLLIEFKTESAKSKQSDDQLFFHDFFSALGYRTEVCRSARCATEIVNEHLNLKVPVYPR